MARHGACLPPHLLHMARHGACLPTHLLHMARHGACLPTHLLHMARHGACLWSLCSLLHTGKHLPVATVPRGACLVSEMHWLENNITQIQVQLESDVRMYSTLFPHSSPHCWYNCAHPTNNHPTLQTTTRTGGGWIGGGHRLPPSRAKYVPHTGVQPYYYAGGINITLMYNRIQIRNTEGLPVDSGHAYDQSITINQEGPIAHTPAVPAAAVPYQCSYCWAEPY